MTLDRLPEPRQRPWITVAELAEITGEGEKTIRAAIAAGTLPSIQVGRYVRIPTAALLDVLGIGHNTSEPLRTHAASSGGSVVRLADHATALRRSPGPPVV